MKGGTIQINWHNSKPVLTLDFHPQSGLLATGGADFDIKLWLINPCEVEKKTPTATYQNSLAYHGSAVNIIRFSPFGGQLASGADGGELLIWKLHSTDIAQTWKVLKTLSFHRKDVLDLQWSADGAYLVSGSVDNSCIIWDVNKGTVHQILDGHLHYVQGVTWDPMGHYIASLSSDRSCRIYINKPQTKSKILKTMNYVSHHVITKAEQKLSDDPKIPPTKNHLFHDETLPSFFRRLAWSPDGSFLLTPAGSYKLLPASDSLNTAYIFSRKDLSRPALQLPAANKPIVAVRFCPVIFSLRGSNSEKFFKLPHRLVFAVATLNSLYIYDTESIAPIAVLAGLHYAAITDIAWSSDGKYLALSSQDAYCTLVEFESDELGSPITIPENKKVSENPKGKTEEDTIMLQQPEETISVAVTVSSNSVSKSNDHENKNVSENTKGKEEDTIMLQKPEETISVAATVASNSVSRTHNDEKQTTNSNKPAKRRITPMAID